jgi:uncharacterized protein YciI
MKHCMVEITYTAPLEKIDEVLPEHRAYLQLGYDSGMLLCSGPMTPRTGGVVLARAESIDDVKAYFAADPYRMRGMAEYRFVEFSPVKHQPFLKEWV